MATEPRFDASPTASNHFAWIRTTLALQRTLMAATRTAVSLIGFGFTVAQFFEKVITSAPGKGKLGPEAPRNLGMLLIAAGVLSLAVFIWQYYRATRYLRTGEFQGLASVHDQSMRSASYLTAYAVIAVGIAAFGIVFARL